MSGLFVGVPLAPEELGANDHIAATERALRQAADAEGAVILGRAGVFVLRGRSDTLHVRLDGPVEARLRQAMAHEGLDEQTAREMQQEADQAREAYISHFYQGARWDDPRNYHLVLDSTAVSLDACVEVITAAARDLFKRTAAQR
jgi:cytidylate kinase